MFIHMAQHKYGQCSNKEYRMIKTFLTLLRGGAAVAEQTIIDRNVLAILDQQMRDGTQTLHQAKRSLALAIVQHKQEIDRIAKVNLQIDDIEQRVRLALEAKHDDLALEGAMAIAELEAERNASHVAQSLFDKEIARLRNYVKQAETRLTALDRGRRVAKATQAVSTLRQGRTDASSPFQASLSDAEATLKRFSERAAETQNAEDEFDKLNSHSHMSVAEKLSSAGFGTRLKTTPEDVLNRLKSQAI
jgi:phage shock protein A